MRFKAMYLLDTNIVSELRKPRPRPNMAASVNVLPMDAACAIAHKLTVVTRNVGDFKRFDAPILNPFEIANCDAERGASPIRLASAEFYSQFVANRVFGM